jgi:hypothetical protein
MIVFARKKVQFHNLVFVLLRFNLNSDFGCFLDLNVSCMFSVCFYLEFILNFTGITYEMYLMGTHCELSNDFFMNYFLCIDVLTYDFVFLLFDFLIFFDLLQYYVVNYIQSFFMVSVYVYLYCFCASQTVLFFKYCNTEGTEMANVEGTVCFECSNLILYITVCERLDEMFEFAMACDSVLLLRDKVCYGRINGLFEHIRYGP